MSRVDTVTLGPTEAVTGILGGAPAGKRYRVLAYKIDISNNTYTSDSAGVAEFKLSSDSLDTLLILGISYLPSSAPSTATGAYSTGWMELGEGLVPQDWTTDETILFESSKTVGGGMVMCSVRYVYEDTTLPVIVNVAPLLLSSAGGEVLDVQGYNFDVGLAPTLEVDGVELWTVYQSGHSFGFLTAAHASSTPGNPPATVVVTTPAGSDSYISQVELVEGVYFYNPTDLPTINSLDIATIAAGDTSTITATGLDFNAGAWNNCDQVGFFSEPPPTGKPPLSTAALVGSSIATYIGSTSMTFQIGDLAPGVYYVLPDTTHCPYWMGTSQVTLTVT